MVGRPKKPTPAYRHVALYVDAKTFQVRRIVLIDAQGNQNRFEFSSASINEPIPASELEFKPPPGTQIIRP